MIKTLINPDDDKEKMPRWAVNYLEKNNLFKPIGWIKRECRHEKLLDLLKGHLGTNYSNVFYFNKKGDVVFFWPTAAEKTLFLLKWS